MYVVGTRLFQVDKWTSLTSGQVRQVNRLTSERVACNKRQGNRRTQVSRQVNRLTSGRVACNKRQGNRRTQVSGRVDWLRVDKVDEKTG